MLDLLAFATLIIPNKLSVSKQDQIVTNQIEKSRYIRYGKQRIKDNFFVPTVKNKAQFWSQNIGFEPYSTWLHQDLCRLGRNMGNPTCVDPVHTKIVWTRSRHVTRYITLTYTISF